MEISSLFFSGNRAFMRRGRCTKPGAPAQELFHDRKREDEAKAFCEPCPVRAQCLEYAMTEIDADYQNNKIVMASLGVWGGASGADRIEIRKQRKESNG